MNIRVRRAEPMDALAVANVYLRSRKELVACAPLVHSDVEVQSWIRDVLLPTGGVRVAETDASVTGFVAVSRVNDMSWIDQLYVLPGCTGAGIGSRLLEIARDELRPPIRVYTFQSNGRARRFYERHGFHIVALGDGSDNEEGCPDILFEWSQSTGLRP